jgi:hypothetical protein
MNRTLITTIPFLLLAMLGAGPHASEKTFILSHPYFPTNNGAVLVFESSFGESTTTYSRDGAYTISSSESDRFKYRQKLIIQENGVYAKETYQYFKIFLFVKQEATLTYGKPLLRFPLPLRPGAAWQWEGDECSNGDTNRVRVTGRALGLEVVDTKAGKYEAMKLETFVEGVSTSKKNRVTEWYVNDIGLIKIRIEIEGGGVMGILRDLLGYGKIESELKEIRRQ